MRGSSEGWGRKKLKENCDVSAEEGLEASVCETAARYSSRSPTEWSAPKARGSARGVRLIESSLERSLAAFLIRFLRLIFRFSINQDRLSPGV